MRYMQYKLTLQIEQHLELHRLVGELSQRALEGKRLVPPWVEALADRLRLVLDAAQREHGVGVTQSVQVGPAEATRPLEPYLRQGKGEA